MSELRKIASLTSRNIPDVGETLFFPKYAQMAQKNGDYQDVTTNLNDKLRSTAEAMARALNISTLKLTFTVPRHDQEEYVLQGGTDRINLQDFVMQMAPSKFIDQFFPHAPPV